LIFPKTLKPGDLVAITAVSGFCNEGRLHKGIKIIESLDLKVQVMKSCYSKHDYFAGDDKLRLTNLHEAFNDKKIKAVFTARGGYGAARLLPFIDYNLIKMNPKIFVGFSDVTALHIAFNQICKLVTFHGPMPAASFPFDEITLSSLHENLFESKTVSSTFALYKNLNALIPGEMAGIITGGNLSVIAASIGTAYEINTKNRILFLEETNEPPYKVDRLLLQLKQAGKLRDANAIILGDLSPESYVSLKTSINEILLTENKPIYTGLQCGHCTPNITLPLGTLVNISHKGLEVTA